MDRESLRQLRLTAALNRHRDRFNKLYQDVEIKHAEKVRHEIGKIEEKYAKIFKKKIEAIRVRARRDLVRINKKFEMR